MNNFWVTLKHTTGKKLKSKSFKWSTIIISVIIILLMNIGTLSNFFSGSDDEPFLHGEGEVGQLTVVVMTDGDIDQKLVEMLIEYQDSFLTYINDASTDIETTINATEQGEYDYALLLADSFSDLKATLYGSNIDYMIGHQVLEDLHKIKDSIIADELGLSQEQLAKFYQPIHYEESVLSSSEAQIDDSIETYFIVYGLVFAIYMIVLLFGSMIATEVATEKSSRVMELIVSSVNPIAQMFGKILGIGLSGLINLMIIVAAALFGYLISGEDFLHTFFENKVDLSLITYALLFIILGYLIYGGIAAMLGALVSRAEEVNQALQPLVILAMISFFVSMFGIEMADATFIKVLSYIPFFTPQLLFLRIAMTTIPMWEIVLIICILVVSALGINILAARIYKGGVLMYGKFSIKGGIKQALRLGKREK
ncbi:MAG: ABC transporter permease [Bacillaceae bacterium]|nr:ABC transporter permease [Bacillaceae bacterium]